MGQWVSYALTGTSNNTLYLEIRFTTLSSPLFPGSISGNQTICYNTNPGNLPHVTYATGGSGPISYWEWSDNGIHSWTDIPGVSTISYNPSTNLTSNRWYRRNATSGGVTVSTTPVKVTVLSPLSLNATTTPPSCSTCTNGSVTLSGSGSAGGYTYSSNGSSYTSNPTFSNLATGTYTFYVKDANNCVASKKISVANGFVTTWRTANPGVSGYHQITIPILQGSNMTIHWGDGTTSTNVGAGSITHSYPTSSATWHVIIEGNLQRISFFGNTDKQKILTVEQWGDAVWGSNLSRFFEGCSNLRINATDAPNLSNVLYTSEMFMGCTVLNDNIDHWDVSNVQIMSGMFRDTRDFNQPLNSWIVSNVTDMQWMFLNAESFNQPLSNWNVSNVIYMRWMFALTKDFNQSLNNWNVSSVTDMTYMFGNSNFNGAVNNWNVISVTDMEGMFRDNPYFNQPLNNWNVSNVTDMGYMFSYTTSFNQNLASWNLSSVTNMSAMLSGTALSRQNYDNTIIGWNNNPNTPSNITLGATGLTYCNGVGARAALDNGKGWWFQGDSYNCRSTENGNTISLDEVKEEKAVTIYPNPAVDQISVKYNLGRMSSVRLKVLDLWGRILLKSEGTSLDVSHLKKGTYLLQIESDQYRGRQQFIKK
jgi:surface protein